MAHFAKLDADGNVLQVLVVDNKDLLDPDGVEQEVLGRTFLFNLTGHRDWKQTSYNGTIRKNFAGIGSKYDKDKDAFIPAKPPYDSWVLDEQTCLWKAPVAIPEDGKYYEWDEAQAEWKEKE